MRDNGIGHVENRGQKFGTSQFIKDHYQDHVGQPTRVGFSPINSANI